MPTTLDELRQASRETYATPNFEQREAENYPQGHFDWHGLRLQVETPINGIRAGHDAKGKEWRRKLQDAAYGSVKGVLDADGEPVDVYMGAKHPSAQVFGINQVDQQTGKFQEHKFVLDAKTPEEAKRLYLEQYPKNWRTGSVVPMSADQFKTWLQSGDKTQELRAADFAAKQTAAKTARAKECAMLTSADRFVRGLKTAQFPMGMMLPSPEEIKRMEQAARLEMLIAKGVIAPSAMGAMGAGVGGLMGGAAGQARGRTLAGVGRGVVRGGATGVGAGLGGLAAETAAKAFTPGGMLGHGNNWTDMASLAGLLAGGTLGYGASGKLLGNLGLEEKRADLDPMKLFKDLTGAMEPPEDPRLAALREGTDPDLARKLGPSELPSREEMVLRANRGPEGSAWKGNPALVPWSEDPPEFKTMRTQLPKPAPPVTRSPVVAPRPAGSGLQQPQPALSPPASIELPAARSRVRPTPINARPHTMPRNGYPYSAAHRFGDATLKLIQDHPYLAGGAGVAGLGLGAYGLHRLFGHKEDDEEERRKKAAGAFVAELIKSACDANKPRVVRKYTQTRQVKMKNGGRHTSMAGK